MSKLLQTAKNLLHHDKTRPEATAVEKVRPALPSVPSGSPEMAIPALGHTTGYVHEMVVQDVESRSSSTAESGVTPRVFTSPSAQTSPASTMSTLSPGSIGNTVLEHRAK